jgi:solute carrier family 25 carnitine/acylcarnitine transporter 20/29
LCCGGLAGVVTWASIFPLDVIKTRVQTWDLSSSSLSSGGRAADGVTRPLLPRVLLGGNLGKRPSSLAVARQAYQNEGIQVFFRGLGVCSARAFVVNAVQWAVSTRYSLPPFSPLLLLTCLPQIYEWMMKMLTKQ